MTESGYRLYDSKALERLQEIMFFKELATGSAEEIKREQDENVKIYRQFMTAREEDNEDLAKEYLQNTKLAEVTDSQFGKGCSKYVANAINRFYGV